MGLWEGREGLVGRGDGSDLGLEGQGGASDDTQAPGLCTWKVLWICDVRNTGRRLIWGAWRSHDFSQHNFKCLEIVGAPQHPPPRVTSGGRSVPFVL